MSNKPITPFGLRMPPDIKAWVRSQAKKERMSVNSWLLRLIEKAQDDERKCFGDGREEFRRLKENAPTAGTVGASE
jgi:hypothetical protein